MFRSLIYKKKMLLRKIIYVTNYIDWELYKESWKVFILSICYFFFIHIDLQQSKKNQYKSLFQPFHLHEGSSIPTEQFNLSNRMYRSWIDIPGNAISVSNAFPPKREVAMIYATGWSRNAKGSIVFEISNW